MHLLTNYNRFEVEIKKVKFTSKEGVEFDKTAIVTFFNKDRTKSIIESMGYMDEDTFFNKIDKKEEINLNHCFIDCLSFSEYRKSRSLDEKEMVEVNGFSAKNSLIDSVSQIDFSYAQFENTFDLEDAQFTPGDSVMTFTHTIFHAKKIIFQHTYFNDNSINFTNTEFKGTTNFKNAIFGLGDKDFQDAKFGEGSISFVNAEFGDGDVSFTKILFGDGNVSFKIARFGTGKIDFRFARFGTGDISFERTEFGNGRVDFRAVEFNEGKMNFNRAIFGNGEVSFEGSQMNGDRFFFKRVEFGEGTVNFQLIEYNETKFILDNTYFGKGKLSFYNSQVKLLSLKSCHLDDYLDLRLYSCEYIDLSDTIIRDIVDLTPLDFDVKIDILNMTGMKLLGSIYIDWEQNNVVKLIKDQEDTNIRNKADQFRILKQNFNNTGHYVDEDKAYVEFKRLESYEKLKDTKSGSKLKFLYKYPLYIFEKLVFDYMGLYATNPMRVLASMIVVLLSYSFLYFLLPFITNGRINTFEEVSFSLEYLKECIYYSGITFFTIGYGEITPLQSFRTLAIIEGFSGVFMMSYFTVAFVRKILR